MRIQRSCKILSDEIKQAYGQNIYSAKTRSKTKQYQEQIK